MQLIERERRWGEDCNAEHLRFANVGEQSDQDSKTTLQWGICSHTGKKNEDITLKENGVNELMIQGLYLSNFEQEQKKKKPNPNIPLH